MSLIQPPITSLQNTTIKSARRLHHSADRSVQSKFLVEGPNLVREAIAAEWPLVTVFFETGMVDDFANLFSQIRVVYAHDPVILQPVSREVLRKLGSTDSVCPIIAVARQSSDTLIPHRLDLAIAVESLQDPGNLGSLIRIAAAAGANRLMLDENCVDATNPKVLRSSAGQWFRNPPVVTELVSVLESQNRLGVQTLAAAADGKCLWTFDLTRPTMFVLGNEGAGLSSKIRSMTTDSISIPMSHNVESLNVAICGAVLTYEARRQRARSSIRS